tara:strand:+ start:2523 stop:3236 length:714 start_codon:yes stop_codon:yes gene_type:complete
MKKTLIQTSLLTVLGAAVMLPVNVQAFGLDSITSKVTGSDSGVQESGATVDVDTLVNQQKDLMGRFSASMNNMLLAQAKTLEATGYKDEADRATAAAQSYSSGNVISDDAVKRDTELTSKNQALIESSLANSGDLSAEARSTLLSAVPHYAVGMYEGTKLPDAFKDWTDLAQGGVSSLSSNPMKARKLTGGLSEVTDVVSNLPALLSAWTGTSRSFMAYARNNQIDVSDIQDKLGDL